MVAKLYQLEVLSKQESGEEEVPPEIVNSYKVIENILFEIGVATTKEEDLERRIRCNRDLKQFNEKLYPRIDIAYAEYQSLKNSKSIISKIKFAWAKPVVPANWRALAALTKILETQNKDLEKVLNTKNELKQKYYAKKASYNRLVEQHADAINLPLQF